MREWYNKLGKQVKREPNVSGGNGGGMNHKGLLTLAIVLIVAVGKVTLVYPQQPNDRTFTSVAPIVYCKDGEGIFIHNFSTGETKRIYRCSSASQYFLHERSVFYKNNIIFGVYDSREGYKPYDKWEERYLVIDKDGGNAEPYSTLAFTTAGLAGFDVTLKENFQGSETPSIFKEFPRSFKLIISETGGSPQIHALYKNVDNKCVFVGGSTENGTSDKTIRFWDLKTNNIKTISEFHDTRLPIYHGGGGYDYPYFLNKSEIVFLEHPREKGVHTWLGIGLMRWAYLKKLNLDTQKTTIIDKLEGSAEYPKVSPEGKFIIYGIQNNIWIKDIKSGKKIKIDNGHSCFWLD